MKRKIMAIVSVVVLGVGSTVLLGASTDSAGGGIWPKPKPVQSAGGGIWPGL